MLWAGGMKMGIRINVYVRNIDLDELKQQIKDLLLSDCKEESKIGLHNLLGEILDQCCEAIEKCK